MKRISTNDFVKNIVCISLSRFLNLRTVLSLVLCFWSEIAEFEMPLKMSSSEMCSDVELTERTGMKVNSF